MKKKIRKYLYRIIRPIYLYLETLIKEDIRKELQQEQLRLAEQKLVALYERRRLGTSIGVRSMDFNPDYCNHLKGGTVGPTGGRIGYKSPVKDYALRFHTFPNGKSNIVCTICMRKWTFESPDWQDIYNKFANCSSNTKTSSEIVLKQGTDYGRETE